MRHVHIHTREISLVFEKTPVLTLIIQKVHCLQVCKKLSNYYDFFLFFFSSLFSSFKKLHNKVPITFKIYTKYYKSYSPSSLDPP